MPRQTDFSWDAFCERFGIRLERDAEQLREFMEVTGIDKEYTRTLRTRGAVPPIWWIRTEKRFGGGEKSGQFDPEEDRDVYVYEVSACNRWRARDFAVLDGEQLRVLFPHGIGGPVESPFPRMNGANSPPEPEPASTGDEARAATERK